MTDRTVLITGATAGIGEAAARTFAAAGWRVIGTGRRADRLEATAANRVQATVKVAANCPLGEHPVRVRTKGGITELKTFYVGPFPVVSRADRERAGPAS